MDHRVSAAEDTWKQTLQECRATGFNVLALDTLNASAQLAALADEAPPLPVRAFADDWLQAPHDPWRALISSAATVNPGVADALPGAFGVEPLRALLTRAERAAVVYGHPTNWKSSQQWAYLLQIPRGAGDQPSEHILLHLPALPADIARAEHVLNLALPPSYTRFLMLTNGFGFGARELSYICGAGPARADWNAVLLNLWMQCNGQHEIGALWRAFQGTYAYERIMDREAGQDTFQSDETILVPFAQTYDAWCFDSARQQESGEYPVIFWDHEQREARDAYADFAAWCAAEIETHLFGE